MIDLLREAQHAAQHHVLSERSIDLLRRLVDALEHSDTTNTRQQDELKREMLSNAKLNDKINRVRNICEWILSHSPDDPQPVTAQERVLARSILHALREEVEP